jgi:hypothetical protein
MRALQPATGRGIQPQIVRKAASTSVAVRATPTAAAESSTYASGLTPELVSKFREDGYLALPGFASKQQVAAMMQRANELVEQWDPDIEARRFSVFTTKEEQSHAKVGGIDDVLHVSSAGSRSAMMQHWLPLALLLLLLHPTSVCIQLAACVVLASRNMSCMFRVLPVWQQPLLLH